MNAKRYKLQNTQKKSKLGIGLFDRKQSYVAIIILIITKSTNHVRWDQKARKKKARTKERAKNRRETIIECVFFFVQLEIRLLMKSAGRSQTVNDVRDPDVGQIQYRLKITKKIKSFEGSNSGTIERQEPRTVK